MSSCVKSLLCSNHIPSSGVHTTLHSLTLAEQLRWEVSQVPTKEGRIASTVAERTAFRTSQSDLVQIPAPLLTNPVTLDSSLLSLGLYLHLYYENNIRTYTKDLWSEISERIHGKQGARPARAQCMFALVIVLGVILVVRSSGCESRGLAPSLTTGL